MAYRITIALEFDDYDDATARERVMANLTAAAQVAEAEVFKRNGRFGRRKSTRRSVKLQRTYDHAPPRLLADFEDANPTNK